MMLVISWRWSLLWGVFSLINTVATPLPSPRSPIGLSDQRTDGILWDFCLMMYSSK